MSVNLIELGQQLSPAFRSLELLQKFVKSDLANTLDALGRVEYRAAVAALRDAARSNDPAREMESAITILRLAHQKFSENSKDSALKTSARVVSTVVTGGLHTPSGFVWSAQADAECCVLLAACYASFSSGELCRQYLHEARKAFDLYIQSFRKWGELAYHRQPTLAAQRANEAYDAEWPSFNEMCEAIERLVETD